MKRRILIVLILLNCSENKSIEKLYILFIKDTQLVERAELNAKKIDSCKKGEVVELIDEVKITENPTGRFKNYHIFLKVNCKDSQGYIDFKEDTEIEMNNNKNYLIQNKNYIFEFNDFKNEITGFYNNKKVYVEFFGNITTDSNERKTLITNVVVNPMFGEELSVVKIKDKQYLLFNYNNIIRVDKKTNGVYIEVMRGNDDFKTLHKKKFDKIIREDMNYESGN